MTRKVTSYRLPEMTLSQIKQLTSVTGSSDANVIAFAIDRMFQQENTMSNSISINRDLAEGEWKIFDNGQHVCRYDGKLWNSVLYADRGATRLRLTPLTPEQQEYINKHYPNIANGTSK